MLERPTHIPETADTRALAAYAEAGYQRAGLTVDTANPTGALGLYQRCGFMIKQRWTTHARPL